MQFERLFYQNANYTLGVFDIFPREFCKYCQQFLFFRRFFKVASFFLWNDVDIKRTEFYGEFLNINLNDGNFFWKHGDVDINTCRI